jgi:cytoskeletal protein RodZ
MSVTIGQILTGLREEQNLSRETLAKKTSFPLKKIESLETDQFSHFPGKFYYFNYLKEYLRALKVNPRQFQDEHRTLLERIQFKTPDSRVQFSRIRYQRYRRKRLLIILLLILAALAAGAIGYFLLIGGDFSSDGLLGRLEQLESP